MAVSVVPLLLRLTRRKMGAALPKGAATSEQEQGGRMDGSTTSQAFLTESMLSQETSNNFTLPTPSKNGQGSTLNDCHGCKISYSNIIERNVFLKVTDEFFDIILNQTTVRCGALSAFT